MKRSDEPRDDDVDGAGADPRANDPRTAQIVDPQSGVSDDPRVDSTPDQRQSDYEKREGLEGGRGSRPTP